MINLFKPYISNLARWEVVKTIFSDWIGQGPRVDRFEKMFSKMFKKRYCVAVNSGTSALELAYDLIGIKPGDEVIVPVLTCTATNIPLLRRGAKLVFADIDDSFNMRPSDVKNKITKKTKAIVFVHFGGSNSGMEVIRNIAYTHGNIPVVEDAAQAIGTKNWGKAQYTAVSFQAIKTLTTGDGGMLVVQRREAYDKALRLRWFGIDRKLRHRKLGHNTVWNTDIKEAGYKYQMTDIAAAMGIGNLKSLHRPLKQRRKVLERYRSHGIDGDLWLITTLVNKREQLLKKLEEAGINAGMQHFRNDEYTLFGGKKQNLPIMNAVEDKMIHLPIHHKVTLQDVDRICKIVKPYLYESLTDPRS